MGKVRGHISDDTAALAQWVMRKLRNHDPMSVREKDGKLQDHTDFGRKDRKRFRHIEGERIVEYCLNDGRSFRITVEPVEQEELLIKAG